MIVLIIVGLLSAMVAPRLAQATTRANVDAAAQRLIDDLERARVYANATSQRVDVSFDVAKGKYEITKVPDPSGRGLGVSISMASHEGAFLAAADFNGGTAFSFDGFGQATLSGTVTITSNGETRQIALDKTNGRLTAARIARTSAIARAAELAETAAAIERAKAKSK